VNPPIQEDVCPTLWWQSNSKEWVYQLPTATRVVGSVAFSPDGTKLADGGGPGNTNVTLEIWDATSGSGLASPKSAPNIVYVSPVVFSPDGNALFVGAPWNSTFENTPDGVEVFSMATFSLMSTYNVGYLSCLAVSPLDSQLAYGALDGTIAVALNPYYSSDSVSSMALKPTIVVGGTGSSGTVTLSQPAPPGNVIVLLNSNAGCATVPSSVTVLAGATQATFMVATTSVAVNTTAVITASTGGATASASLVVAPYTVSSLTLNPTSIQGGNSATGTLTLSEPASVGGTVISLSSSDPTASVPAAVTVAAGATVATFTVSTVGVYIPTLVTITAGSGNASQSATLTITPATLVSISLNPATVVSGNSSSSVVGLSGVAPNGGVVEALASSSTDASVPTSVLVPSGQSSVKFSVSTTSSTVSGSAVISASLGSTSRSATLTITPSAGIANLTLNPSAVEGGNASTATLVLSPPAPVGGAVVDITSSDPSTTVPAKLAIAAGATTASFTVKTIAVDTQRVVTITVGNANGSQSAFLTVSPASLVSVTLNPATVVAGSSSQGLVTLSGPTGPSGFVTSLSTSSSEITVPASVTVPSGQSSVTFSVGTIPTLVSNIGTVTATIGTVSKSATLSITPAAEGVLSVMVSPTTVAGGSSATGLVTLIGPAGAGGVVVSLTCQQPSLVSVPATCTIPAGASSITFTITTSKSPSDYSALISATLGSSSQGAYLSVTGYHVSNLTLSPSTVTAGGTSTGTVFLEGAAPIGGWQVTLNSYSYLKFPRTVSVPEGASSATFAISVLPEALNYTFRFSASDGYATKTATLSVNGEGITSLSVNPNSVDEGNGATGTISLMVAAPAGGWLVHLSSDTSVVTVPSTVTIPAGATSANFQVSTNPTATTITSNIQAHDGQTAAVASLTVHSDAVSHLSLSPTTVGSGGASTGTVTLKSAAPAGGWVVKLSASAPSLVNMPSNVTVSAGATTASFTITGKATSTAAKCTITATDATSSSNATLTIAGDRISSLKLTPSTVGVNGTSVGTVTLKSDAPTGGWLVKISTTNTNLVSVPSSVLVLAGATSAKFEITAKQPTLTSTVTVEVTDGNSTASESLKIEVDSILSLTLSPSSVVGGANSTGIVKLKTSAPPGGWSVKLTSANSGVAKVPQTVLVPAGSSSVSFKITTEKVTATSEIAISVSDGASSSGATLTVKS